jgi:probable FeS assembly SUF system protein SufT
MQPGPPIELSRACDAIEIPAGTSVTLPVGKEVRVTQAAGGSLTVMDAHGAMFRIAGHDADALGIEPSELSSSGGDMSADAPLEHRIVSELRTCYDPEIPVNIVDLGLVFSSEVSDQADGRKKIEIRMALTAPGCGMGDVLASDIEEKLGRLPGVGEVDVEIVLDPPWDPSRMSEAARLELGWM